MNFLSILTSADSVGRERLILSKWDYFEVSSNDPDDREPVKPETEKQEEKDGWEQNNSFVSGPYSDGTNRNAELQERNQSGKTKNYGMWLLILFTVVVGFSIAWYVIQPKTRIGIASSVDSSDVSEVVTAESSVGVSQNDNSAQRQKLSLAFQLREIGQEILNSRPYSGMRAECQKAGMSEEEYNQLLNDYQQHDKSYFLKKFEEYTLAKFEEATAGSAVPSN